MEDSVREDIIRLAQEAGIVVTGEAVWKLCELVAAVEREACANVAAWILKMPENDVSAAIRARGNK